MALTVRAGATADFTVVGTDPAGAILITASDARSSGRWSNTWARPGEYLGSECECHLTDDLSIALESPLAIFATVFATFNSHNDLYSGTVFC
jgi:hypothetical protein